MKKIYNILLINPKDSVTKGSLRRLVPPLGLLYIGAVLEKNGYNVSIIDSPCEGYENIKYGNNSEIFGLSSYNLMERLKEQRPDLVGVTCATSKQEEATYETCKMVKLLFPDIPLVVGGIHPSFFAKEMLIECPDIDFIISKEGESRLLQLIVAINNCTNYEKIDGLSFRKNGTEVVVNSAVEIISKLDDLPLPARHLIDMEKYIQVGLFGNPFPKGERVAQVLTSRGCPYKCDFCATKPYWGKFRRRSADNIISEMKTLKNEFNVQEIQFRDDNLTVDRQNALSLFNKMRRLNLFWSSGIMIKGVDDEMMKAIADSGCYKLTISPESGNERVLKELINKPLKLEWVKPFIQNAHKHGISIHCDFIVGYPGEHIDEILNTFQFAREIEADSASFFIASPYPGSPLYERCKKRGWLTGESYKTDFKTPGIHIPPNDPEYIMPGEELVKLVDAKTREHNEWSKQRNPDKWKEKYKIFLEKHNNEREKIMGRVV